MPLHMSPKTPPGVSKIGANRKIILKKTVGKTVLADIMRNYVISHVWRKENKHSTHYTGSQQKPKLPCRLFQIVKSSIIAI